MRGRDLSVVGLTFRNFTFYSCEIILSFLLLLFFSLLLLYGSWLIRDGVVVDLLVEHPPYNFLVIIIFFLLRYSVQLIASGSTSQIM